jgi:hypothetical protein
MSRSASLKYSVNPAAFWIACIVLTVLKFLLVSCEEIVARYQPLDDLWQIMAAARGYWFGIGYDYSRYAHLPAYSLWIAVVYFTGIPLRLAMELVFLAAAFVFTFALIRAGFKRVAAPILYAFLIFHPASFQLFNYTMPDTFYASVLLFALAALIVLWVNRESVWAIKYAVLTGVSFAVLWHTRKETILIIILLAAFTSAVVLWLWRSGKLRRSAVGLLMVIIVIPTLILFGASFLVRTANWLKFGLFVSSEMDAPGYKAAYRALLRIRPDIPIRFVPVPKEVREKAYRVSPAFKELEPFLEGEFSRWAEAETQKHMGIQNEIAAGWFYWVLRQAAAEAGYHSSARQADAFYRRVATEINAAIDDERLSGRIVLSDFLDPELSNYIPYLGQSLMKMVRLFISVNEPIREKDDSDMSLEQVRKAFDRVANRRAALTGYSPTKFRGWFFDENERIRRVVLRGPRGEIFAKSEEFHPRQDVSNAFSNKDGMHAVAANIGFELVAVASVNELSSANFVFTTRTGSDFTVPYKSITVGKPETIFGSAGGNRAIYAFDIARVSKGGAVARDAVQSAIWLVYGNVVALLTCLGIGPVLLLLVMRRTLTQFFELNVVVTLLLIVVCTRVALFALVDASSWPADQSRYLFPAMIVYSSLLIIWLMIVVDFISNWLGCFWQARL